MNTFLITKLSSSSFVDILPVPQCCFKFRLVNYRLQIQIASVVLVQQTLGHFKLIVVVFH